MTHCAQCYAPFKDGELYSVDGSGRDLCNTCYSSKSTCNKCKGVIQAAIFKKLAQFAYHVDCFRCDTCNVHLTKENPTIEQSTSKVHCQTCNLDCSGCKQKLRCQEILELGDGLAFHEKCYKCSSCNIKLQEDSEVSLSEDGLLCANCAQAD
eukprot:TRINITY_DN5822_c0_g1_i1.p1 TRINITY_DN5822_c0_g1~~TRINITY_DN5822_c0_g1_i1.p1  ORF type:complete len:152 (+),score=4.38 TRINITY_DN5822_c0_g1_i1:34-489(+)